MAKFSLNESMLFAMLSIASLCIEAACFPACLLVEIICPYPEPDWTVAVGLGVDSNVISQCCNMTLEKLANFDLEQGLKKKWSLVGGRHLITQRILQVFEPQLYSVSLTTVHVLPLSFSLMRLFQNCIFSEAAAECAVTKLRSFETTWGSWDYELLIVVLLGQWHLRSILHVAWGQNCGCYCPA